MDKQTFRHVDYLWDDQKAAKLGDDQVALFLYRSNILGADLRITNYGGGNTSCKTMEKDPLTAEDCEVMWVKGSGGDIGTLKRDGIAGLYTKKLRDLKGVYRGPEHEDEMVGLFNHCLFDLDSRAPSIDTPLHALLPFAHIDHLHPDALISIAAARDSEKITKEIWGDKMGWVPWQRPGFDLALQLENCLAENPGIRGIVLGGHGLFTWGDTSKECYENSLEVIETAARYIEEKAAEKGPAFGGAKVEALPTKQRRQQAIQLMPVLRGLCSAQQRMIGHFNDSPEVLEFINSQDLERLAPLGTSCPDHFLRTKIQPLILPLKPGEKLSNALEIAEKLEPSFDYYRGEYIQYYERFKREDSPAMRDPNPVVILYPGVGMFTFAKNKQTARVAAEFYVNAINVMRGSEAITAYTALPREEAFNIEYWLLEEAKLKRQPPEKPLSRRVALISGAAGGIGKAIGLELQNQGACVVLTDNDEERLNDAAGEFNSENSLSLQADLRDAAQYQHLIEETSLKFGGVDILVHSAGLAISSPLNETSDADWDLLQDVLAKAQFQLARAFAENMKAQGLQGDIINIVSKNALVSGPNNVAYGTAKAAQLHMNRLLAAELGPQGIRVNALNPDAVIVGSHIWEGDWAEGRAKAYGISVEKLPAHYAARTLLNEIIYPEDIAKAAKALLCDLKKSTGQVVNVDGGIAAAFPR